MAWRQRVVIIGGGFAGVAAAKALKNERVDVLLLDRQNHHLFQPLLYQVATCALSAAEIAFPIRHIFARQPNTEVLFTEVTGINLKARSVETTSGPIDYHFLILAAGAETNFYGHADWAEAAPGLKTLDEALEIRRKVLLALELAEQETDPARRRELLTFCVIGGGPTGVELAGALIELSRGLVRRDYRHIAPSEISVRLIEGGPAVLKTMAESMQGSARRQLESLGVIVHTGSRVVSITDDSLSLIDQTGAPQTIPAATILWAAGVRAVPLTASLGVPLDPSGRVHVTPALNIPGYDEVFCAGDAAACVDANGVNVPGVAPAAMQMGKFAAQQIVRRLQGMEVRPFVYRDKGSLATIGKRRAVAQFRHSRFSGVIAWYLWLVVHIMFLIGFRNRLIVLTQWVWQYVTSRGGARIITGISRGRLEWPAQPRRLGRIARRDSTPDPSKLEPQVVEVTATSTGPSA